MLTSTGRQALLSNRCRNVADNGLSERRPILRPADSALNPPSASDAADENPCLVFSERLRSNDGGDETNKSFSLWLTTSSFPFSCESRSPTYRSGEQTSCRGSLRPLPPPELRLRSIRRVFRRRRWITGLVVGLRVGLPATAHWVARSLNFCKVAIFVATWGKYFFKLNSISSNFCWLAKMVVKREGEIGECGGFRKDMDRLFGSF